MEQKNTVLNQQINDNGGWDNWEFNVLENYLSCSSKDDSNKRVVEWQNRKKTKNVQNKSVEAGVKSTKINLKKSSKKTLECPHCMEAFSRSDALKRHVDGRCKVVQQRNKDMENTIALQQQKIELLESQNKQIENIRSSVTNNITNHNNMTNNTIINNVSYRVQLGSETIADLLTDKEKKQVLSKLHGSLLYYIHKVHFSGEYPEYLNVALTNLRSKYAHKYSEIEQKFITDLADKIFSEMVDSRFSEICDFYDERKAKLNPRADERLNNFIDGMKNNPEKYKKAMDDVMLMAYNNREKVDMNNCVNKPELEEEMDEIDMVEDEVQLA
tara:strand:- start:23760 stop:24743 length:984 start_codon:yes stop_codon:yes gene_type:complete